MTNQQTLLKFVNIPVKILSTTTLEEAERKLAKNPTGEREPDDSSDDDTEPPYN